MEGWIKTYRSIVEWEWHTDPNMVSLWMHLLVLANFEDKRWRGIVVKRGQLVTGRKALSDFTGISERTIRTCLKRLEETNEISIKTTNKYSVITILKYDSYQCLGNETDQQPTSNRPTTDQQLTTTKEYKEDKNIKKRTTKVVTKESFIAPEFEDVFNIWLEYKHQRRESYKSEMSLKMCYNKLLNLSNGDPFIAGLIVEQSIANNWAGLFALKNDNNERTKINGNTNAKLLEDGVNAINALAAEGGNAKEVPF